MRQLMGANGYREACKWLRGVDLNHRPLGYEPNELPDCSTPRLNDNNRMPKRQTGEESGIAQFDRLGHYQMSLGLRRSILHLRTLAGVDNLAGIDSFFVDLFF